MKTPKGMFKLPDWFKDKYKFELENIGNIATLENDDGSKIVIKAKNRFWISLEDTIKLLESEKERLGDIISELTIRAMKKQISWNQAFDEIFYEIKSKHLEANE